MDSQAVVIAFLETEGGLGHSPVERIDTHSAIVFLSGSRAWKLKRAVRYDYLNFSSLKLRKKYCEAELRLNQRTAPDLYRRVVPVTREGDGSLALEGSGNPVEWLVEMSRFDQNLLFDRLAENNALEPMQMSRLGQAIAQFHQRAVPRPDHGGLAGMSWIVEGNAAGFVEFGADCLDAADCESLIVATRRELEQDAHLLDARRASGHVRECHGDLHLRNIVLLDDQPTLFDAIEFNDRLSCVDVLYDLSFLLMDLWYRRLPGHANRVWNSYLAASDQSDGVSLMPLFLSCRAAVRAKTSATAAHMQVDPGKADSLRHLARGYLGLAVQLIDPPAPRLIAIGGMSGSGKSTLAYDMAPTIGAVPGAVVLRSDEIRKRLFDTDPIERLGQEAYTPEVTATVYATMRDRARQLLLDGHSVIADAVHARLDERDGIEQVARDVQVPFSGLWLGVPEDVLIQRVEQRGEDASDADANVVRLQTKLDPGPMRWHRLDASATLKELVSAARTTYAMAQRGV